MEDCRVQKPFLRQMQLYMVNSVNSCVLYFQHKDLFRPKVMLYNARAIKEERIIISEHMAKS